MKGARCIYLKMYYLFLQIQDGSQTVTVVQVFKGSVDFGEWSLVGDEIVHLQVTLLVAGHQLAHFRSTLDTTECRTLPHSTSD